MECCWIQSSCLLPVWCNTNYQIFRLNVSVDTDGFREKANESLIKLADKLKVLRLKAKSVYFRALPPKDRKIIHQYLAEDGRIKVTQSVMASIKRSKIYPAKSEEGSKEKQWDKCSV